MTVFRPTTRFGHPARALVLALVAVASSAQADVIKVVKINVGRFDRNVDVAESYGVPLKRGIPAVVVLSEQGKLVYSTRAGELADARKMGDSGIYDFFSNVALADR